MGYNPAGNLTSTPTLTHQITTFYKKTALSQVRQKFYMLSLCEMDDLPRRSGRTVQWYRYGLLGANTTPHAEGTVGTSLTLSTSTVSGTVSEYADFVSVSTLIEETAIDKMVDNASRELGYRAALSVDTITRIEFDSNSSAEVATLGASFTASDARANVASLKASNVLPKSGDRYLGVIHPYIVYDLTSDNTAGGWIDVMKYMDPKGAMDGSIGEVGMCRFKESTNVKTSGTAPSVLYWTYIAGEGGVGAVDLAGSGPSKVSDIDKEAFRINVIKGGPSQADPEGMIGSYVSYRYVYVAKTLDTTNYRFRMVKSDATLI